MSDETVLGIDLGTTFSSMAVVDRFGKASIIPNAEGHGATPSVLHFTDDDACVVGDEAVKMVVVDPSNIVRFIKRQMGEADFALEFYGRSYSPQELSALILKKLKEDAEEVRGMEMRDAVITVPAYFNSAQRAATAEAGEIAGFNVLSIINEPTAAAISYGLDRLGGQRKLMVFDLGGGTFDVTLMEINGISFRTIASDGNAELGGKDWDDRLLDFVAGQFIEKVGLDPRDDSQSYQELYERCLHAKISLSTKPRAVIPVNFHGQRMVVSVTREDFEQMTVDLVAQCAETCQIVLEKAALRWPDLDEVLLVGGSTRMPMVRDTLRQLSGDRVAPGVSPEDSVALGAALAGVLRHRPKHPALLAQRAALARKARAPRADSDEAGRDVETTTGGLQQQATDSPSEEAHTTAPAGIPGFVITDATTHPLGVMVLDRDLREVVVPLIPESTPLPCERRGRFAYAYDGMTAVRVEITEGSGDARDEVDVIGEVILENLPPRPRGTAIEVVYRYTINQILEVDVLDVETRAIRRARMDLKGGLGNVGVDTARARMSKARVT